LRTGGRVRRGMEREVMVMVRRTNGQRGRAQIAGSDESNGRRIRIRTSGPGRAEEQAADCIQERVATGTHAQGRSIEAAVNTMDEQ
jgi:hypothetical protein